MFAKKKLGQHFLRDRRILERIAAAAKLTAEDVVLEVGPGEGTLTEFLLKAGKVVSVEKDDRLIPLLHTKFASEIGSGRLELVHGDILELSIINYQLSRNFNYQLSKTPLSYKLRTTNYKLVANLPYYITGQFLRKFLQETAHPPVTMVLLLQKEVAKRIVAQDGKESILSISVKAYGTPSYRGTVKAGAFSPPPAVDSGILAVEHISKKFFEGLSEERFFTMLKRGFAHPRKLLASNLGVPKAALGACNISEKARPGELSLQNWLCLAQKHGSVVDS